MRNIRHPHQFLKDASAFVGFLYPFVRNALTIAIQAEQTSNQRVKLQNELIQAALRSPNEFSYAAVFNGVEFAYLDPSREADKWLFQHVHALLHLEESPFKDDPIGGEIKLTTDHVAWCYDYIYGEYERYQDECHKLFQQMRMDLITRTQNLTH